MADAPTNEFQYYDNGDAVTVGNAHDIRFLSLPDDSGATHNFVFDARALNYVTEPDKDGKQNALVTTDGALAWFGGSKGTLGEKLAFFTPDSITFGSTAYLDGKVKLGTSKPITFNFPVKTADDTFAMLSDLTLANVLGQTGDAVVPTANGGTGASTITGARKNLGLGSAATKDAVSSVDTSSNVPTANAVHEFVNNAIQTAVTSAVDYLGTAENPDELIRVADGKAETGDIVRATQQFTIPAGKNNTAAQTVHAGDMIVYTGSTKFSSSNGVSSDNWQVAHSEANEWETVTSKNAGIVPAIGASGTVLHSDAKGNPAWGTIAIDAQETSKQITSTGSYTPSGSVTVGTKTISHITSVGSLPTFNASYDSAKKALSLIFGQGSLPTTANVDVGAAGTVNLSGSKATISVSGNVNTIDSLSASFRD